GASPGRLVVETITNRLLRVADLTALGTLARERRLAMIVDSTFTTPILCRPLEHGATLVMHSATKYIGGHGDVSAGLLCGSRESIERALPLRSSFGGGLDPFAARLPPRGLRTLAPRVERQGANAAEIAHGLERLPGIERVHYPGLASHADHARAARLHARPGAMVSFELSGGGPAARRFYDRVRLIARASSLGEVESLLTHP